MKNRTKWQRSMPCDFWLMWEVVRGFFAFFGAMFEQVKNETDRLRILQTLKAIEGFVMCSVIATGLIQLITLRFSAWTPSLFFRYLRTPAKAIVPEATVAAHLRQSIFRWFAQNKQLSQTQSIRCKQNLPSTDADLWAS